MSKKKAFSCSTMTLKDFHGGSIPSDISLPSAPGVIVKPSDRSGYDRQASWGNNGGGRSDHRLRPHSSGSMRGFDDKSPFLTNTVNIGKYFDEDERKPLDGLSGSRRIVSDDNIRGMQNFGDAKQDVRTSSGQQSSVTASQLSGVLGASLSEKVVERGYAGPGSIVVGGNVVQAPAGSYPNAWGVRKELGGGGVTKPSPFAAQNAIDVSKYAHASALDKVTSGRWKTKPTHNITDVEVIRQSELQSSSNLKEIVSYDGIYRMDERGNYETDISIHAGRSLTMDDGIRRGSKDLLVTERGVRASIASTDASNAETASVPHGNLLLEKPGLSDDEAKNRLAERPILNLKPRSQPVEQHKNIPERRELFGGARPRELVLKERGANDVVAVNDDLVQTQNGVKIDVPRQRTETMPVHPNRLRRGERGENLPSDHRAAKDGEKRDHRLDGERAAVKRNNWRSGQEGESHHQQHQQERKGRQLSPETWRKPVDQPKAPGSDKSRMRYGKVVSAVELAQTFSRSISEPKSSEQYSGQGGRLPEDVQIPFSRLTAPATQTRRPQSQINGY